MKTNYASVYPVLFSALLTAVAVLSLTPHNGQNPSYPTETSFETNTTAASGSMGLGSREDCPASNAGLVGVSTALYTVDVPGEEIESYPALSPEAKSLQNPMMSIGSLSHVELILEANRIMEALYRDGLLPRSGSSDNAWVAMSSPADKATSLIEQFRHMHQQHIALLLSALAYGDQDSLVILAWSRIRFDAAKIHKMAAELRNETALATR